MAAAGSGRFFAMHTQLSGDSISGRPTIVAMGPQSAGKTSLVIRLTGAVLLASPGGESVTKKVAERPSRKGQKPFDIFDTPGTGSIKPKDILSHALAVRYALTDRPITAILLVVRYDRLDNTVTQCIQLREYLPDEFHSKIIVCSTHWDMIPDDSAAEFFNSLREHLNELGFHSLIGYGSHVSAAWLSESIYKVSSRLETTSLIISDSDFAYLSLGPHVHTGIPRLVRAEMRKIKRDFHGLSIKLTQFVHQIATSEAASDRDEVLYSAHLFHKQHAEQLAEEFSNRPDIQALEKEYHFYSYNELKKSFGADIQEFTVLIQKMLRWDMTDSKDPHNQIKRCPHCNVIWWKVEGCDGQTRCGNRTWSQKKTDSLNKPFVRIEIIYSGTGFTYQKNELPPQAGPSSSSFSEAGVGCGQTFIWKDCPILSDAEIEQVLQLSITDYKAMNQPKEEVFADLIKKIPKETLYETESDRQNLEEERERQANPRPEEE